jgi:hypothetical protein
LLDLLLLAEFAQEQHGQLRRSGLKRPCMKDSVRFGIDGGVQPVALAVDLNHRFVGRGLIRLYVTVGLSVGFLYPVANGRSTSLDIQFIEYLFGIRK